MAVIPSPTGGANPFDWNRIVAQSNDQTAQTAQRGAQRSLETLATIEGGRQDKVIGGDIAAKQRRYVQAGKKSKSSGNATAASDWSFEQPDGSVLIPTKALELDQRQGIGAFDHIIDSPEYVFAGEEKHGLSKSFRYRKVAQEAPIVTTAGTAKDATQTAAVATDATKPFRRKGDLQAALKRGEEIMKESTNAE